MADQPSPRRRFQFRLRMLMIGVTLFCVVVGGRLTARSAKGQLSLSQSGLSCATLGT